MWETLRRLDRNTIIAVVALAAVIGIPTIRRFVDVENRLAVHDYQFTELTRAYETLQQAYTRQQELVHQLELKVELARRP